MKYEDLHKIYWDINSLLFVLNKDEQPMNVCDAMNNLNWALATIHEELRDLETYENNCG